MSQKTKKPEEIQDSMRFSIMVSLSDITINLIASIFTGSAVLFSQALQGLSDVISSVLVLFGYRHSRRRANKNYPLGYGREMFFWILIASLLTGASTGLLSISRGLVQIRQGAEIEAVIVAVVVLVIGFLTNAYSIKRNMSSMLEFRNPIKKLKNMLGSSFVDSKASILIDSIGAFSGFVGIVSILLYIATGNSVFDGYGAVIIGTITLLASGSLVGDIYGFIVGKTANEETVETLKKDVLSIDGVIEVGHIKAIVIGSGDLLVILDVLFDHHLSLLQVENRTAKIKQLLKKTHRIRQVVVQSQQHN